MQYWGKWARTGFLGANVHCQNSSTNSACFCHWPAQIDDVSLWQQHAKHFSSHSLVLVEVWSSTHRIVGALHWYTRAQINTGWHKNNPHSLSQVNMQPWHWKGWEKTPNCIPKWPALLWSALGHGSSVIFLQHARSCKNETSECYTEPGTSEGWEKCFACCCQRLSVCSHQARIK